MARPQRIGIDATTWWDATGFGRFTRGMVTALAKRDSPFSYTVMLEREPDETLPPGVEAIVLARKRQSLGAEVVGGSRAATDLLQAARAVSRAGFDLFFFPTLYSYFPVLGATPVSVTVHDTIAERFPELAFRTRRNAFMWRLKARLAQQQAERIVTVSRACAEDIERFYGTSMERIDVVTEGADPMFRPFDDPEIGAQARVAHGIPRTATLLTYVGGISPHKNLLSLVRALPLVLGQVPHVHLAIVGGLVGQGFADNVQALKSLIRAEGLERHVHLTGRIRDDELVALLNGTSALAYPSLWEGFGLPAAEAMACGVPVLASRRGSLPEIVASAGLFFEPESPRDIADTVLRFCSDRPLRTELSRKALERSAAFTWDRGAAELEVSFRRTLRLPPP